MMTEEEEFERWTYNLAADMERWANICGDVAVSYAARRAAEIMRRQADIQEVLSAIDGDDE